jgi:LacI family gluconate utilization system Gnt-I transcriptional repressor
MHMPKASRSTSVPVVAPRRRSSGQATLGDVAVRAGVAPITVSRFIRDPRQVSDELRTRIETAVAELEYVPNRIAQGLAGSHSSAVVAIMPSLAHSVFAQTLHVLTQHLQQYGYQILLGNSGYSLAQEEDLLRTFLNWRPAALVLTGHNHTQGTAKLLAQLKVPVIETWDINARSPYFQVGFSHLHAGAAMADYLLDRGYRRVAYVHNCLVEDLRSAERGRGYSRALEKRGERPLIVEARGNTPFEAGGAALCALMRQKRRPDAIFFANDNIATGAVLEAQRQGWRVPDDIAIAGFGGFPIAEQLVPALTTLQPLHQQIGEIAAGIILQHYGQGHGDQVERRVDVGFEIARRESA